MFPVPRTPSHNIFFKGTVECLGKHQACSTLSNSKNYKILSIKHANRDRDLLFYYCRKTSIARGEAKS